MKLSRTLMIMIKLSYNYSRMLSENKGEKEGKVTDALSQLRFLFLYSAPS